MATARVIFRYMVVDSQEYGSNDEHAVSRMFFDMSLGGHDYPGLSVDIKQSVGSNYEAGSLEISSPPGYVGRFNYTAFRAEVEKCYRSKIGSSGSAIHVSGQSGFRIYGSRFDLNVSADIPVD